MSFGDATTGFPAKGRLRNERTNSILLTRHYLDLGSASDCLNQISHTARRFSDVIWRGNSSSVLKCRLFSQGFSISKRKYCLQYFIIYIYTFCSLRHTRNLTLANSVCETPPKSLLRKYKIEIFKIAQPFP